jgi:hypothetical protein
MTVFIFTVRREGDFSHGTGGMKTAGVGRGISLLGGLAAMLVITPAIAQDNYEAGKTPAQMFATDCAICHKNAAGLSKAGGMFGLESFLREHYTASRDAAAKIAGYLRSVDAAQPPRAVGKRREGEGRTKSAKPGEPKSGGKSGGSESKSGVKSDTKTTAEKPAEPKPVESKPAESKPAEIKPAETPASTSPPAAKPDKPE